MTPTYLQECGSKMKVLALTGIRSEYDLLFPLLNALRNDPCFELGVVACGAHFTSLHHYSIKNIEADGFRIAARIENFSQQDSPSERAKSAGRLLSALPDTFQKEQPDVLVILGDREEPLMAAIAAGYMSIPIIHIAGGDNTHPEGGNIDEEVRHAITKLSHVHFAMAEEHAQRIRCLGEEPWRVFTTGNPGLDRLRLEPFMSREELSAAIGSSKVLSDYLILIYHSLNSATSVAKQEIELCLKACVQSGLNVLVGSPNSDPGFEEILSVIKSYESHPQVRAYGNLPRSAFVNLLRHSKCVVGNSSLAIHEAPFFGLPCVNVGERQKGRLNSGNVEFVTAEYDVVLKAIEKAAFNENYRGAVQNNRSIYGDGHMVEKAIHIIKSLPERRKILAKSITY